MLMLPVTPNHRRTGLPELLQQPQMRLHGSLELMSLVKRQDVLEHEGGVVWRDCVGAGKRPVKLGRSADAVAGGAATFPIPVCLRRQAPDLGSSRQAHP